jgi:hypothetical protein
MNWASRFLAVSALVISLFTSVGLASAADDRDFQIKNTGTTPVHNLYVSRSSSKEWGNDILGATGTIEAGAAVNIVFKNPSDECIYDVQAVYEDGSAWEAVGLDLCTITVVTVNDKDITWE